jgi:hypothetical protein
MSKPIEVTAKSLKALGYTPEALPDYMGKHPNWYANKTRTVRVCLNEEDGTSVHAFTDDNARLNLWSITFTGGTPAEAIHATLKAVVST